MARYYLHLAGPSTIQRVVREGWQVAGGQVSLLLIRLFCHLHLQVNKTMHMLVTPRVKREVRKHLHLHLHLHLGAEALWLPWAGGG